MTEVFSYFSNFTFKLPIITATLVNSITAENKRRPGGRHIYNQLKKKKVK